MKIPEKQILRKYTLNNTEGVRNEEHSHYGLTNTDGHNREQNAEQEDI